MPRHINQNTIVTILLFMCIMLAFPFLVHGQSSGAFKKEGDNYFAAKNFRSALSAYRQGGLEQSTNKKVLLNIGVCLYEINDVDGAMAIFNTLIQESKTDPKVFLLQGKCYQAKGNFAEALASYKTFLKKCNPKDPEINWAKDEIVRCANGLRLKYGEEVAYLENAGTSINTRYAEFGVKTSPTTIEKIYFNSDREDLARSKSPDGNVDIYGATLENGRWTTPVALPSHINSSGYDEVRGFSTNGQVLYWVSALQKDFVVKMDTFSQENIIRQGKFSGPGTIDQLVADLFFFNDSICLFSSDQPGGLGGYDLYISIRQHGRWSVPANLGPSINSFYDERFPFLTQDGLTLYFSSNSLKSVGGLDVFSAYFDPEKLIWSMPSNLGIPINSPFDDEQFVLAPDGMTAYLNSNRKEGYGDHDIYSVFFKQPIEAHQHISMVPTFYHSIKQAGKKVNKVANQKEEPVEIKEYYISHLYFNDNIEILSPQNTKKLDLLANLLTIYPNITAELSCFELPSGQRSYNLYFSIKKAEKAAEYLIRKGVNRDRLLLKGYGASFPLVAKPSPNLQSPLYEKLNQRLEITPHNYSSDPVKLHIENVRTPENLRDAHGVKFTNLRHEMYYSIQIASITQILQNQAIDEIEEMFIEVDNSQGNYQYMAGMLSSYKEAENMLLEMRTIGFHDARIVPYLDGKRITSQDIPRLAEQYPDLLFYLTNKQ